MAKTSRLMRRVTTMLKPHGIIAGLAFAAAVLAATPASALNFRNGYIAVTNATSGVIHVSIPGREEWGLAKDRTVYFNDCCYVAGTTYHLTARLSNRAEFFEASVIPRLCSKHASPYGYAHLVVHDNGRITRVDAGCP